MKKMIATATTTAAVVLGTVLLAPSAWAMVPPEPDSGGPGSTATSYAGIAAWQVVAIVLVAVAIGAVGTVIAQRMHREADASTVSMA
jgi:hypothetical protein